MALGSFTWSRARSSTVTSDPFVPSDYPTGYPHPTYIPKGYQLSGLYRDLPDGFGGMGEIALLFINLHNPTGVANPLSIRVAPKPQRAVLGANEHREGKALVLSMASSKRVEATYYEGMWVLAADGPIKLQDGNALAWDPSNLRTLVFKLDDYTIGVRGSQEAGIDVDELIRVATSIR
jgi:hypothetical protein